jgi:hypothetical protein
MIDNPVYLPNGHEECTIPGWYFFDEAYVWDGPYRTKESAEQALDWYRDYIVNRPKEK